MLAHGRWSFEGEGWRGPLLRRVVGVGVERARADPLPLLATTSLSLLRLPLLFVLG